MEAKQTEPLKSDALDSKSTDAEIAKTKLISIIGLEISESVKKGDIGIGPGIRITGDASARKVDVSLFDDDSETEEYRKKLDIMQQAVITDAKLSLSRKTDTYTELFDQEREVIKSELQEEFKTAAIILSFISPNSPLQKSLEQLEADRISDQEQRSNQFLKEIGESTSNNILDRIIRGKRFIIQEAAISKINRSVRERMQNLLMQVRQAESEHLDQAAEQENLKLLRADIVKLMAIDMHVDDLIERKKLTVKLESGSSLRDGMNDKNLTSNL